MGLGYSMNFSNKPGESCRDSRIPHCHGNTHPNAEFSVYDLCPDSYQTTLYKNIISVRDIYARKRETFGACLQNIVTWFSVVVI